MSASTLAAGADRMRKGWFQRSSAAAGESAASYTSINAFSDEPTPSLDLNPERNARLRPRAADQPSDLQRVSSETQRHVMPVDFDRPSADIESEPTGGESLVDDFAHRGFDFDDSTENSSREIAKRFAPASAAGLAKELEKAPMPPAQTSARSSVPPVAAKPVVSNGLLAGLARNRALPQWKRPSLNMLKRAERAKTAAGAVADRHARQCAAA